MAPAAPSASTSAAAVVSEPDTVDKERILYALECAFADYSLSVHGQRSGLLARMESSADGYVHASFLVTVPQIKVVAKTLAEVQAACTARSSDFLEWSEDRFRIRRKTFVDFEALKTRPKSYWHTRCLYVENVPKVAGVSETPSKLAQALARSFGRSVDQLVLPPLYDPSNPLRGRNSSEGLPGSGGPFRGFAFLALGHGPPPPASTNEGAADELGKDDAPTDPGQQSEGEYNDVQRVLTAWPWGEPEGVHAAENGEVANAKEAEAAPSGKHMRFDDSDSDEEESETLSSTGTGEASVPATNGDAEGPSRKKQKKKPKPDFDDLARANGMRTMALSRFFELKREYIGYQDALYSLRDTYQQR